MPLKNLNIEREAAPIKQVTFMADGGRDIKIQYRNSSVPIVEITHFDDDIPISASFSSSQNLRDYANLLNTMADRLAKDGK